MFIENEHEDNFWSFFSQTGNKQKKCCQKSIAWNPYTIWSIYVKKRNCVFATKLKLSISISLQPDSEVLLVWNMQGLQFIGLQRYSD